jgi:MFS family permease
MMVSSLPAVILGPIGGTVADRYSRKTIIIICDVINGVVVLSLAVALFVAPGAKDMLLAWLFTVSVIVAIVGSFFRPAIAAAIPDLVPKDKIAAANSLNQSSVQISTLIGQGAGGVLFRLLGAPVLFLIDGLTYLFSAFSEWFITIPQTLPEKSPKWRDTFAAFKADTIAGFRYVWSHRGMRTLFAVATLLNFFGMPFFVLFPFYVEDVLRASTDWYGFLLAAFGIGSLAGYTLAGTIHLSGKMRSRAMIAALILMSGGFGGLGAVDVPIISLVIVLASGMLNGFFNINVITILQVTTPSELRGRVFGLLSTFAMGLAPIGLGLSGIVADLTNQNIPLIFMACGGILAALSMLASMSREFRNFLEEK